MGSSPYLACWTSATPGKTSASNVLHAPSIRDRVDFLITRSSRACVKHARSSDLWNRSNNLLTKCTCLNIDKHCCRRQQQTVTTVTAAHLFLYPLRGRTGVTGRLTTLRRVIYLSSCYTANDDLTRWWYDWSTSSGHPNLEHQFCSWQVSISRTKTRCCMFSALALLFRGKQGLSLTHFSLVEINAEAGFQTWLTIKASLIDRWIVA